MTTAAAVLARPRRLSSHRVLGALGVLGAPVFLVLWANTPDFVAEGPNPPGPTAANLLMLGYLAGWAASAAGLRRLRATGRGRGARVLTAIQGLGLAMAASQTLQDVANRRPLGATAYAVTDAAWPLSHLCMLAVFAAVWRAGVWRGWRRWAPLACGLVLPVGAAAGAAGGRGAAVTAFAWGTALAFAALGVAVATAEDGD